MDKGLPVHLFLYKSEIEVLDQVAADRARITGGRPNRSEAARVIINTFRQLTRSFCATDTAGIHDRS